MATLKNMGGLVEGAKGKRGEEKTVALILMRIEN